MIFLRSVRTVATLHVGWSVDVGAPFLMAFKKNQGSSHSTCMTYTHTKEQKIAILLGFCAGLRRDVANLKRDDIDLKKGEYSVATTKTLDLVR